MEQAMLELQRVTLRVELAVDVSVSLASAILRSGVGLTEMCIRDRHETMPFAADCKIPARIEAEGKAFFQSEIAADDGEEPPRLPCPVPPLRCV